MRIAIIGAGIAGLSCADGLAAAGHGVVLFDKGRGPGGRMSTRRVATEAGALQFDHGAQYFTARDPAFVAQVDQWEGKGIAARWSGVGPAAGDDAWVGTPTMNAPVRALAAGHAVQWGVRIEALTGGAEGWMLVGDPDGSHYDAVVVAVPAEQVAPLLGDHQPEFAALAAATPSDPSWTAMIAFVQPIAPGGPEAIRGSGALGWAARDGAKPRRSANGNGADTWVVQASPAWSTEHLEDSPETVAPALLAMLAAELGVALPSPTYLGVHRWRYAKSGGRDGPGALWDAGLRIGACGDWLLAPRVEAAWLSGRRLATMIVGKGDGA